MSQTPARQPQLGRPATGRLALLFKFGLRPGRSDSGSNKLYTDPAPEASEPGRVSLCLAGPPLAGSHQGPWSPGSSATTAPQAYAATQ